MTRLRSSASEATDLEKPAKSSEHGKMKVSANTHTTPDTKNRKLGFSVFRKEQKLKSEEDGNPLTVKDINGMWQKLSPNEKEAYHARSAEASSTESSPNKQRSAGTHADMSTTSVELSMDAEVDSTTIAQAVPAESELCASQAELNVISQVEPAISQTGQVESVEKEKVATKDIESNDIGQSPKKLRGRGRPKLTKLITTEEGTTESPSQS